MSEKIPELSPHSAIGTVMLPLEPSHPETSIFAAASDMADYGLAALPVEHDHKYMGMITESNLATALANNHGVEMPLSSLPLEQTPSLFSNAPIAQAVRLFESTGANVIAVTDESGYVLGVITPSRLICPPDAQVRPKPVGGMATPLGVYLTNGAVTGGAGAWGLLLSGAVTFLLLFAAQLVGIAIYNFSPESIHSQVWFSPFSNLLAVLVFLLGLKATPVAGYHAAEHMTVHAIERGEPLVPEIVARMPRVHPRCGTNIAAAALIFSGIISLDFIPDMELRMVLALILTAFLFRPFGSFLQLYFTTRKPNQKQLENGIEAGKKLIHNYQTGSHVIPNNWMRLAKSGLFHVMAGAFLTSMIVLGITTVLNVPEMWRVI